MKSKLNQNQEQKKLAMKIANEYADRYKILEQENLSLKSELENMSNNLKINKSFIFELTKDKININNLEKSMIELNRIENNNYLSTINMLKNENSDLKRIINLSHVNYEPIIAKYQKSLDTLQNKVFLLENSIGKKDNIIKNLNHKIEEIGYCNIIENNAHIQEIAIVDPNKTTLLIHDDLLLYKHVFDEMSISLRETIQKNTRLEKVVDSLREENSRYINLFKNIKASALKDHKYLINDFYDNISRDNKDYEGNIKNNYNDFDKKVTPYSDKDTNASLNNKEDNKKSLEEIEEQGELESENEEDNEENIYSLYSPIAVNYPEKIKIKSNKNEIYGIIPALDLSKANNINYKLEKKDFHGKSTRITKEIKKIVNEEWEVAFKHAGLKKEDIIRLSKNKLLSKFFEAIINLNRIIIEKNSLLTNSLNKLKQVNDEKNKKEHENIELYKKFIDMRNEVEKLITQNMYSNSKYKKKDDYSESSIIVNHGLDKGNISERVMKKDNLEEKDFQINDSFDNSFENHKNDFNSEDENERISFSDRQRYLLSEINELHTSLVKDNDEIKEYLNTEIFERERFIKSDKN